MRDCTAYFKATGRRLTFEYTLMHGVNDAPQLADELASLLTRQDICSHVNLIPVSAASLPVGVFGEGRAWSYGCKLW
jgi:adenine C2-methylase RlmN of 23S rRNA A2503 and tRNA A37